jgi:hypothetical protein
MKLGKECLGRAHQHSHATKVGTMIRFFTLILTLALGLVIAPTAVDAQTCPYDPRCLTNPYGAGNPYKPRWTPEMVMGARPPAQHVDRLSCACAGIRSTPTVFGTTSPA